LTSSLVQSNGRKAVSLHDLFDQCSARHDHLCPRQVLGVRMGLAGADALGIELPNHRKQLLTIVETDGCFADGIEVSTGCTIGHRTLRLEDCGKVAATFVDVASNKAIRLIPRPEIREQARLYCPDESRRYFYQMLGYQKMPDWELFQAEDVELVKPIERIRSRAGARAICELCGEEILNEREVENNRRILCLACNGKAYYRILSRVAEDSGRQTLLDRV